MKKIVITWIAISLCTLLLVSCSKENTFSAQSTSSHASAKAGESITIKSLLKNRGPAVDLSGGKTIFHYSVLNEKGEHVIEASHDSFYTNVFSLKKNGTYEESTSLVLEKSGTYTIEVKADFKVKGTESIIPMPTTPIQIVIN